VGLSVFVSCDESDPIDTEIGPLSHGGKERNMIVVISDIHLGADLSYAEITTNLKALESFLEKVSIAPNVKELVIA